MTLAFLEDAEREVSEAFDYLERERPGHGVLLAEQFERVVARAERFPRSAPIIRGLERHEVRSFGLPDFPYSVVTARIAGALWVIAFAHAKRAPGYWRDRLR